MFIRLRTSAGTRLTSSHSAVDPFLGVFTGVFAYYLYEHNPRTAPPERDRLLEVIQWKRAKMQKEKEQSISDDEILKAIAPEVDKA